MTPPTQTLHVDQTTCMSLCVDFYINTKPAHNPQASNGNRLVTFHVSKLEAPQSFTTPRPKRLLGDNAILSALHGVSGLEPLHTRNIATNMSHAHRLKVGQPGLDLTTTVSSSKTRTRTFESCASPAV